MNKKIILSPIKVNLMLHVLGRTNEGFHHLQSLMALFSNGDEITFSKNSTWDFSISGPFSENLTLDNNMLIQAIDFIKNQNLIPENFHTHIHLHKNIPVASGIGGGSANAAAVIKGILDFWGISLTFSQQKILVQKSGLLGADVPVCLGYLFWHTPLFWLDGTGKEGEIEPLHLQKKLLPILLVNPNIGLSTPAVFQAFHKAKAPYMQPIQAPATQNLDDFLKSTQNNLQRFSTEFVSEITTILEMLTKQPGCQLARMSGSGATCFGIFNDISSCEIAQKFIQEERTEWWTHKS